MKPLIQSLPLRKWIFILALIACFFSFMSPALALFLGVLFAQIMVHPFAKYRQQLSNNLLKVSVVGLGFGMDLFTTLKVGQEGLLLTIISLAFVLLMGFLLGRVFKIERKTSFLIAAGTAICGGSAIAALSPVIAAKEQQISVALGTVFILNAVALFIFPLLGHFMELSQPQFGLWCAIAIHDTSSVVGAASKYGTESLMVATTVKLTRSLWIIPLALCLSLRYKGKSSEPVAFPYFILLFIVVMLANTYIPIVQYIAPYCLILSKVGLTMSLFLIGSGLAFSTVKSIGLKPLLQGLILWLLISMGALFTIVLFF